jgi:hypothetical protein
MINRNLSRRLKRLEEHSLLAIAPPIIKIRFISPEDMRVTKTLVMGPNGMRTWTDFSDPNNPRTWTVVMRKNYVRAHAATFSNQYSWCSPPSTGLQRSRCPGGSWCRCSDWGGDG